MIINNDDLFLYIYRNLGLSARIVYSLHLRGIDFNKLHESEISNLYYFLNEKEFNKVLHVKEAVKNNLDNLLNDAREYFENNIRMEISWTTILRDDYPDKLLNLPDPPIIIYYKGHLPLRLLPSVAVIGARECSEYGEEAAKLIAGELAERGVQIISGMARGIDGIAQKSAIDAKGNTYGILGSGPDIIYPRENNWLYWRIISHGGILSEYPPGTKPDKYRFPERNSIISGLADVVLVVEARKKSGTYITVNQALEQGKEVFAVPGRINDALSEGCNELIATGAGVAYSSSVIIDSLLAQGYVLETDIEASTYKKNNCYRNERISSKIIEFLSENSLCTEEIYEKLGGKINYDEIYEVLTDMQIDGAIEKRGARFHVNWNKVV